MELRYQRYASCLKNHPNKLGELEWKESLDGKLNADETLTSSSSSLSSFSSLLPSLIISSLWLTIKIIKIRENRKY